MPTLPTAAALAALVVMAGVSGVVAADRSDVSTAAVTTTVAETDPTIAPDRDDDRSFEERLADRLDQFNLTDEQVRSIVSEAIRLRDDGASRLVIRSSILMNLYEYGVDAPFLSADAGTSVGDRIADRLGERFDLTDKEVAEIAATIDRMRDSGASRAEIYRAVRGLLIEFGVDEDEVDDAMRRAAHHRAHELHDRADRLDRRAHRLHHLAHRLDDDPTGNASVDG